MRLFRRQPDLRLQADTCRLQHSIASLPIGALLIALLLPFAWSPGPAHAQDDRAVLTDGRGSALWWSGDRSALLESANGGTQEVDLQPEVRWTSLAVEAGGWTVAGRKGDDRLVLMQSRGNRVESLPAPRHGGKMIGDPALLADSLEVQGLAWLEGDAPRSLGVRAAMRRSDGWAVSTVVSPPGPGTQTALVATALSDGRYLLLWSAFDGQDDEILWSIGRDGAWSRPSSLGPDNRYPDITPAVTAMPDGQALAAWSSYDGRIYRLALSHFDGSRWGERFSQSASADLFPSFTSIGTHRILQARDPVRDHWTLVEVNADGEALERTVSKGAKPVVLAVSQEGVELRTLALTTMEHRDWTR